MTGQTSPTAYNQGTLRCAVLSYCLFRHYVIQVSRLGPRLDMNADPCMPHMSSAILCVV